MRLRLCLIAALTLAASATLPNETLAEERYPSRPIRLIVASAPGGVHDVIARLWADGLKGPLGTIVIDNGGATSRPPSRPACPA
jgi:tripartite-type tricarboxylate transporter receptor subunit TctC